MKPPTSLQWEDVLAVFDQVADAETAQRPALLDRLCANDQGLRDEVQLLLSADASSPDLFLEDADLLEYFEPSRSREEVGLCPGGALRRLRHRGAHCRGRHGQRVSRMAGEAPARGGAQGAARRPDQRRPGAAFRA